MWNERYSTEGYVYGTEPNSFLREQSAHLRSPVLSLAEGEGRNAVFLASLGYEVVGVDGSHIGLQKAQNLAQRNGVHIQTVVADLADYAPAEKAFSSVISIFAHLPSVVRAALYPKVERCLTQGGIFLLEAYSEAQLGRTTGGPKDVDLLMSEAKLRAEFPELEILHLAELEREVSEGEFHTGLASVVQFVGRKPSSSA